MTTLRLQKQADIEEDYIEEEFSDNEDSEHSHHRKPFGKPGRPRGKGRPKKTGKGADSKGSEEEESWEEKVRVKEKLTPAKQQPAIEGYIRIIDYLKKIGYDELSVHNKMNPYNALTASCFWYAVSAQYYSHDFTSKRHHHDSSAVILDRIWKLPLTLPQRVNKSLLPSSLLSFQTRQLRTLGSQISEQMSSMVPSSLAHAPVFIEKRIATTSVAEDDQFISSTRAMLYNFICKKVGSSEKWGSLVDSYRHKANSLPVKEFEAREVVGLQQEEEPLVEGNLNDLLRQQARKKVQNRQKIQKQQKVQGRQRQKNSKKSKNRRQQKKRKDSEIFDSDQKQAVMEGEQAQVKKQEQCLQKEKRTLRPDQPMKLVTEKQRKESSQMKQQDQLRQQNQLKQQDEPKYKQMPKQQEQPKQQQLPKQQEQEQVKFTKNNTKSYNHQDVLLDGILQMPLDKVISILQSSLPPTKLPEARTDFMPLPAKDPLEFVFQLHPQEEKYLEYLKERKKKLYRQRLAEMGENEVEEKQEQFEDAKCQICTDGDYTDDNLIVFCSMCNISLHQRCVGLTKVPAESWICDVCAAFGPAGINLPCPLCSVKGGAMKRTNIHIDNPIFKDTNPGYYEYSRRCPFSKQREEYAPRERPQMNEEDEQIVKVYRNKGQKEEQCYYDYFDKTTYPNETPYCNYVWVHYSCAIWIPECYFQEKNGVINVKGIQNIDKKRFRHECFVCKKSKAGVAIKCEQSECNKYYHPECARKKKVYMQQLNLQKLKYLVFCQEHEPLKLTRQIEYKKKKNRQEIVKFARMIQKYIETYRIAQFPYRLMKSSVPAPPVEVSKVERAEPKTQRHSSNSASDQQFLKNLINKLSKAKMMTVHLQRVDTGYVISSIDTPSKRQIRKSLNRYDQFWNSLTNGQTSEENFKRYERIMQENFKLREKLQGFLSGSSNAKTKQEEKKQKRKKRGKHAPQQATIIEEEGGIFCVCRRPYRGQTDMIECQICNEWYHFGCLGFIGSEADAQNMRFTCMKCMKFEEQTQKSERLQTYAHLFSSDSIIYNFRPPTPQLSSEEQLDNKNYNEIMEQVKRSKDKFNFLGSKKSSSKQQKKKNKNSQKAADQQKKVEANQDEKQNVRELEGNSASFMIIRQEEQIDHQNQDEKQQKQDLEQQEQQAQQNPQRSIYQKQNINQQLEHQQDIVKDQPPQNIQQHPQVAHQPDHSMLQQNNQPDHSIHEQHRHNAIIQQENHNQQPEDRPQNVAMQHE